MKTVILHKYPNAQECEDFNLLVDVNSQFMLEMDSYRVSAYGWFVFDVNTIRQLAPGNKISNEIPGHAVAIFTFGNTVCSRQKEIKTDEHCRILIPFSIRSPWEWIEIID